jgi:hypothetical protein
MGTKTPSHLKVPNGGPTGKAVSSGTQDDRGSLFPVDILIGIEGAGAIPDTARNRTGGEEGGKDLESFAAPLEQVKTDHSD